MISLCMITKNEENYIEDCINSVKSIVDEIIVVDTGSNDKTKAIAQRLGAKLIDHKWKDDFSEARNESLKQATGDWILVLDADEVIASFDLPKIIGLVKKPILGATFIQRNYRNDINYSDFIHGSCDYSEERGLGYTLAKPIRFFKNKNGSGKWRSALSIYSAVGSSWNDRNLLSYQQISRLTIRPDVIAMQDFDGRYGVLKKNFLKYRMAVSFPMFYKRFNPTPYWVAIFGTQNSPSYHMGVFTNVLASSLNKSNNKMPATFGLGFDWVYATEHLSSKVNIFVKAAISLGRLKEE